MLKELPLYLSHLSESQRQDIIQLIQTLVLQIDINVKNSPPIKQHAYRVKASKLL